MTAYCPIYNYRTRTIIFNLYKPMLDGSYSIREYHLRDKEDWKIVINTPKGTATFRDFKDYKSEAEKTYMVKNNPKVPMVMWKRFLYPDVKAREKRKEEEKGIIEDFSIPVGVWEKLRPLAVKHGLI